MIGLPAPSWPVWTQRGCVNVSRRPAPEKVLLSLWTMTRSPRFSGESPPRTIRRPRMPASVVTPGAWKANAGGSTVMLGGCTSFVAWVTVPTL